MQRSFLVGVKGESFDNADGTSRQKVIKNIRTGEAVDLIAEPLNPHDRWAVGVYTKSGQQIGYLPSDARDASAILRGEPINASVFRLTGGTNWFRRTIQGKKFIGVVLELVKDDPDWSRHDRLRKIAQPFDDLVKATKKAEKSSDFDDAITAYQRIIAEIAALTERDKHASAHRYETTPVERLSLLLEKQKKYEDALDVIEVWLTRFDPVQPTETNRKTLLKRKQRLETKIRQLP